MKKLRVYLETSFVSYLTGKETTNAKIASDQAHTRRWWEEERGKCEVFVSSYTLDESRDGAPEQVKRRLDAVDGIPSVLFDKVSVVELAQKLIDGRALPEGESADALHIAAASVAGMDVLLTWNCRHMANPHTLPLTRDIVSKAGYVCPAVMTPKTFLENINMEAQNV